MRERIGRFEIIRELGRGGQGTVYLAHDTRLERSVALKSVRLAGLADEARAGQLKVLLDEARIVSRLQHPNIVALHDAIEEAGVPYLVFEYVEGQTLGQALKEHGAFAPAQAVGLLLEILKGVAGAHREGVLHRDLKPANIMLTAAGAPRIMDFGVAMRVQELAQVEERFLRGTPAYMAPEYIQGAPYTQACDLFALGMMLYALVVGAPAVSGSDYAAVLQRMRVGIWQRPSERTSAIDARLDRLIMQAIAADPAQRFADAAAFSAALENYLDPAAAHKPESEEAVRGKQGTLDFLLRRMRHGSDFPALSSTISSVNQALSAENERASVLCNTILKDFALTNKLLKLVNAVHYNHFGGHVSTVSRAVAILGFDGVRNVALSLVLLEHLQNKSQAGALKEEVTATYFSGVMARQLVQRLGVRDAEYAFICAMFHRLGKLLAVFYLHDEAQAVERLREARDLDEAHASAEVLGISYEELGIGVAREWKFPDEIVDSMRHVSEPLRSRELSAIDRMRALSTLSNELCETVRAPEEERPLLLSVVVEKFGRGLKVNEKLLQTVISESATEVAREASLLGMSTGKSRLLAAARESGASSMPEATTPQAEGDTLETVVADAMLSGSGGSTAESNVPPAEMRRTALSAGVQDITNTLVGDYELNDVLRIILETMYRAIGFKRVLLLVRDQRAGVLRARFGFGSDVNDVVKKGFAVPLNGPRDIFYAAISQGADLCIADLNAEKIRPHVPQWYRELIVAHGMVLFPVLVNHRPVALIYADADVPEVLHFQPEELNLLKTLRNQAVLAIKQKS